MIALAGVALIVALVVGVGAGEDDGGDYKVRAIFNNAAFAIPGQDVMIAGAKVGVIDSLDVTDDLRAAVVLKIDDPGFQDFREDAECQIRLQSVIGEKLVECQPTQPRPEGEQPPPPLPKIPDGQDGAGQRLLPVEQTLTPVGEDLIRGVMRRPYRERFAIILNEFGAGLAGRGKDLRKVIRGANPALRQLDKVLKILADQNRLLADGARSGDRVLAEWAKKRKNVSNLIVQANITAQATAEERANLEKNFETFPEFLRELKPTMAALGAMSEQMTPVARDLGVVGTDVSRILRALGPFSRAGIPAFQTLGDTADVGSRALQASLPTIEDLGDFTSRARNLTSNLSKLLTSLRDEDGIERLMDLHLLRRALDQRLRPVRPLPAHDPARRLQLAGHRREPGLYGELHRRREQRALVQAQAQHAARPHPRGREPRQGDAPVSPPASKEGRAAGCGVAEGRSRQSAVGSRQPAAATAG